MWQISPSDETRYSLKERPGFLRLKHGSSDVFCLMTIPHFDFVFEIDTDYSPLRASDQGGIAVYRDKDTRIELLEYYDPDVGGAKGYNRLRIVRQSDLYSGYGSDDNGKTWELIGTTYMTAPKIGMVLHGIQESQSDTLDIDQVRIYRSPFIQVGNLSQGTVAKLMTPAGVVVKQATCQPDKDFVSLDVSNLNFPFQGKVQIVDSKGMVIGETEVFDNIWGGDVYTYGISLDLEINGLTMREDREFQLGNMQNGLIERKAYIINNQEVTIPNLTVAIESFSEYLGWEWADLAEDLFGQPATYKDSLFVGRVQPGERIPIWIKVTRRSGAIATLSDYKFRITFESEG